jgi:beta propeller repeat protein
MFTSKSGGALIILLLACSTFSECSQVVQITTDTRNQKDPAIHQNVIVWEDDRNGNWDIYGLNYVTGTKFPITTNISNQYDPAIYNDIIIWMDERNNNYDIYGYNLSTSQEFQITTHTSNQSEPCIYQDIVVWQDYRNNNYDIYSYNLATKEEFQITSNASNQTNPCIYQDVVVWQDYRNGNWDIYGYSLSTSVEFQITTDTRNQTNPEIYGEYIIWEDDRNGTSDLYGFNRSLSQEIQITARSNNQTNPSIFKDIIVWEEEKNGDFNIYTYNLATKEEFPLDLTPGQQRNPAIYNDIIIWEDDRNQNNDIYGYNLPITSTPSLTLTVTIKNAQGNPIPNALVTLGPYTGETDGTGTAVLTGIASGSYTLTVSAAGYLNYTQSYSITGNQVVQITLTEDTPGQTFSLAVTVKDTIQNPVKGATITLAGTQTYTDVTDAQGDAAFFNIISGSYTLSVSAPGYQEWAQPINIVKDDIISITVESTASVTITAQNASDRPVSNATVTMTGPVTYIKTTDTLGKVIFLNVAHGSYTLTVSHPDYGTYTDPAFTIQTSVTTTVKLNPETGFIHGIIYWDVTTTPAKDVTVGIYDQVTNILEKSVKTDFEGRFIAEVPRTKKYYIIVEDFTEQKYIGISPVNSLARGALTLIIDSQCRVKGVVIDEEGKEIQGADITIKDVKEQVSAQGTTDSSGLFTIKVTPGTYSIEISDSEHLLFTQTFTVSYKEIYSLGTVTLKNKPEQRIDVPDENPPAETVKPSPSQPLMVPVLITFGVCIVLLIVLVLWGKNKSDFVKNALISVLAGIISIIAMWILFQIG